MPAPDWHNQEPPPIFKQHPELRLEKMGVTPTGEPFLLFTAKKGGARSVTVYMRGLSQVEWYYGYTLWDADTRTEITYHGKHGDPTLDEMGPMEGR